MNCILQRMNSCTHASSMNCIFNFCESLSVVLLRPPKMLPTLGIRFHVEHGTLFASTDPYSSCDHTYYLLLLDTDFPYHHFTCSFDSHGIIVLLPIIFTLIVTYWMDSSTSSHTCRTFIVNKYHIHLSFSRTIIIPLFSYCSYCSLPLLLFFHLYCLH